MVWLDHPPARLLLRRWNSCGCILHSRSGEPYLGKEDYGSFHSRKSTRNRFEYSVHSLLGAFPRSFGMVDLEAFAPHVWCVIFENIIKREQADTALL